MNVVEDGKPIPLGKLEPGSLFRFNNTIALKTEYVTEKFATTAYIIGSGEMFWGGLIQWKNCIIC